MRDFFIGSLEKLIAVIVVLMCVGVVVMALMVMFNGQQGGFFAGLGVLLFGGVYVVLMGGMMYLFLGIHANTKRTAEAVESMAKGGGST